MTIYDQEIQATDTRATYNNLISPKNVALLAAFGVVAFAPLRNVQAQTAELHYLDLGSNQTAIVEQNINEEDIIFALNKVHDYLISNQKTLDEEIAAKLYENRWDLYL